MKPKYVRLWGIILLLLGVGVATALTLTALQSNISYFRTPTEVIGGKYPEVTTGRNFRIGGMVEKHSVKHAGDITKFRVTDFNNSLAVQYRGILPDLFREGQGVVAQGKMGADNVFIADQILAKHDEKYMPPEIAKMHPGAAQVGK